MEDNACRLMEILSKLGLSAAEFYTRVCDEYKIEFVPQEIYMKDVTKEF